MSIDTLLIKQLALLLFRMGLVLMKTREQSVEINRILFVLHYLIKEKTTSYWKKCKVKLLQ
jgi:hypothetical protein